MNFFMNCWFNHIKPILLMFADDTVIISTEILAGTASQRIQEHLDRF